MLELALTAEGAAPVNQGDDSDVQISWEDEVSAGAAELDKLWLVSSAGDGHRPRPHAQGMRCLRQARGERAGTAQGGLREPGRAAVAGQPRVQTGAGPAGASGAPARAAPAQGRVREREARIPATSPEVIDAKRKALDDELARVLDGDGMTGPCDLAEVLKT